LSAVVARASYAPKGNVFLRVAGTTLTVKRDPRGGFLSNVQVGWGFRTVEVSEAFGKAALGKRAKLSYGTDAGRLTLRRKVERASCG
jgi:hypothetical protein